MSLNLPKPPSWVEDAICKPDDDWAFFPAHGGPDHAQAAKTICRRCPVALACLTYALDFGPRLEGVWGGTTAEERRAALERRAS